MKKGKRKAIAYDLDTTKFPQIGFGGAFGSLRAYKELANTLKGLGFEREQKSVFYSIKKMSNEDIQNTIKSLDQKLPWLHKCVNKINTMDVPKQHDLRSALFLAAETRINKTAPDPSKDIDPTTKTTDLTPPETSPISMSNFSDIDIEMDDDEFEQSDERDYNDPEHNTDEYEIE